MTVANLGDVIAGDIVVDVNIPRWAEVVNTSAGNGSVRRGVAADRESPIKWRIKRLEAQGRAHLKLQIVARESRLILPAASLARTRK